MVRFFTFEQYHGKQNIGSSNIRAHQLIKYWRDSGIYKYGENPDVLIFQKVYMTPDYKFHAHFKGIKILDLCDPDHLNGTTCLVETINNVDAVTCSSEALVKFVSQLTDKPVIYIPDRFDLTVIPNPKKHVGLARTIVWFGYRHNAENLKPALKKIAEMNLHLIIISDDDPLLWQWSNKSDFKDNNYTYIKYNEDNIYTELQKADYALLPSGNRPVDPFKSNNRTIKAILAGLPVAKTADDMELFSSADARNLYILNNYNQTKSEYNVKNSIKQYKKLINTIKKY